MPFLFSTTFGTLLLSAEVKEIQPRIILSFGQPVHQILVESFGWKMNVPLGMKEAFGKTYSVDLLGHTTTYVPCIHINSRGHSHYKNLRDSFIHKLRLAVDKGRCQRLGFA
jgi:uracil-DNA glycosylase